MSMTAVIEKVQKLLALSKSSNINEAAAASAAANKLIDQYRLSQADLELQGEASEPYEEDGSYIYESGKITRWKQSLVQCLVKHYGLYVWNDTYYPQGRQVSRYRLVGRKSDITVAKYMFAWLTMECQRLADLYAKGMGRVYVASYCAGFVSGVSLQLNASRQDIQNQASSGALVKINARSSEAEAYLKAFRTNLVTRKTYSAAQTNYQAFAEGKVSGQNLHLGSSLPGAAPKMLGK